MSHRQYQKGRQCHQHLKYHQTNLPEAAQHLGLFHHLNCHHQFDRNLAVKMHLNHHRRQP